MSRGKALLDALLGPRRDSPDVQYWIQLVRNGHPGHGPDGHWNDADQHRHDAVARRLGPAVCEQIEREYRR